MTTSAHPADLEVDAVISYLFDLGAVVVSVGHGRDPRSVDLARRFPERWDGLGRIDEREAFARGIDTVVDWPSAAASWLRPALRLTTGAADAWVIADTAVSFAPMSRRLRQSTPWDPMRTVCFSDLGDPRLTELAGGDVVGGLRGIRSDGTRWQIPDAPTKSRTTP